MLFQSLFSWMRHCGHLQVRIQPRLMFVSILVLMDEALRRPACRRTVRVEGVSILVFMDKALRLRRAVGGLDRFAMFQSLFSWMRHCGTVNAGTGPWPVTEFQSLFSWM